MDRDRTTRTGASEGPWGRAAEPLKRRCTSAHRPPAQNGDLTGEAGSTKDEGKPSDARDASNGQALSDKPALRPYWGKPRYGILGRAMETSASCEARYAPLLYPTNQADFSTWGEFRSTIQCHRACRRHSQKYGTAAPARFTIFP